tara:strand:+ start:10698 stop:10961 length:264 start_codon:yes stop_codon:yes gene_type:complete
MSNDDAYTEAELAVGIDDILRALSDNTTTCGSPDGEKAAATLAIAVAHFLTQVGHEEGLDHVELFFEMTRGVYKTLMAEGGNHGITH